jgi:hypothetical protein
MCPKFVSYNFISDVTHCPQELQKGGLIIDNGLWPMRVGRAVRALATKARTARPTANIPMQGITYLLAIFLRL